MGAAPYEGIEGAVGGRFVNRLYEASSKTRVILSERSESKNLRTEGQQCRNDNAKILRLRTSCFAQDDRGCGKLSIITLSVTLIA